MSQQDSLLTKDFCLLNAITFLVFCNVAVFFDFHHYLESLPIPSDSYGLLIGLFSLVPLLVRPFISPFLRPDNARFWIIVGNILIIAALLLYGRAQSFWYMAGVRVFHGFAYVLLATAVVARIVACVPSNRSAQAFGLYSVVTLLPYAVVPPTLPWLNTVFGGFGKVLIMLCICMFLVFPFALILERGLVDETSATTVGAGPGLVENFTNHRLWLALATSLLVWSAFSPIFYFVKGYGEQVSVPNPGWFFTLSTLTEMGTRVFAGSILDRLHKGKLLAGALALLMMGYIALALVVAPYAFYGLGLLLGLGWGITMPLLNGIVFDISVPRYRALNTNLVLQMFQGGFLVGPMVGGALLTTWGYGMMFYACAGMMFAGICCTIPLAEFQRPLSPTTTNSD